MRVTPRSEVICNTVNRKAQLERLGESGRLGLNKMIIKRAADAPNSPGWKKQKFIIQTKYNGESPNLVMIGKVDESTIT